ncbi:MAG: biopolymer transporter ExbD [Planctomycetota bacterium]
MRRSRVEDLPEPRRDLTPMIDVVFLLIVFFMVATELTNLELEELALPRADQAREPAPELGQVPPLVINVLEDGEVRVRGRRLTSDPARRGQAPWFSDHLRTEVAVAGREDDASRLEVTLRVDKDAEFGAVQRVFEACCEHGVIKTRLAADPSGER